MARFYSTSFYSSIAQWCKRRRNLWDHGHQIFLSPRTHLPRTHHLQPMPRTKVMVVTKLWHHLKKVFQGNIIVNFGGKMTIFNCKITPKYGLHWYFLVVLLSKAIWFQKMNPLITGCPQDKDSQFPWTSGCEAKDGTLKFSKVNANSKDLKNYP